MGPDDAGTTAPVPAVRRHLIAVQDGAPAVADRGCGRSTPRPPRTPGPVRGGSGPAFSPADRLLLVRGDLDVPGLRSLQERCYGELDDGATSLVLDFSAMTACPGVLFTVISELGRIFRRHHVRLQVKGLADAVRTIAGSGSGSGYERVGCCGIPATR